MEILLIFWLLCGVVCYFIMKSKGYPNDSCFAHGVGGALLGVIWLIVVLCKKDYSGTSSTSQLSDMELLSKLMDLKERGAITEAEFEEKKRELLSNVKKNDKPVNQTNTFRMVTVLLLFVECIISGIGWLYCESGFFIHIVSHNRFLELISSYGVIAIICVIMAIILIMKVDVRFLCIPIIAEGFRWLFRSHNIFTILCVISTILFLILVLFANKKGYPVILYILPGISRIVYGIYWFLTRFDSIKVFLSRFDIEVFFTIFYTNTRVMLPIAFIFLGLLIHRLSTEKAIDNTAIQ